ncbi:MAG TPA: hypothetical protein DD716_04605 [Thiomicrospira sp.]|jgi:hypothetical protein|nr:hypothetical protein [Thiomicrospira sp.]
MKFIANYSMKGQSQSMIAVLLLSMITVWFAPLGMLLGAVIALVTLRVGVNEGLKVLLIAMVANVGISMLLTGSSWSGVMAIAEYMLPIWLLALVLRKTNSLASVIHLAMLMAGVGVVGFYLAVGEPVVWWTNIINSILLPIMLEAGLEAPKELMENMAKVATMFFGMFVVILWTSILLIARWWQSELYFPGKFREDFFQIRLPKNVAYLAIVVALAGLLVESGILRDLSGVIIAGLMFPGLAIAHQAVDVKKMSSGWLIGLYFLLFIFPQMLLIVAAIGLVDTWLDIRSRWIQSTKI